MTDAKQLADELDISVEQAREMLADLVSVKIGAKLYPSLPG